MYASSPGTPAPLVSQRSNPCSVLLLKAQCKSVPPPRPMPFQAVYQLVTGDAILRLPLQTLHHMYVQLAGVRPRYRHRYPRLRQELPLFLRSPKTRRRPSHRRPSVHQPMDYGPYAPNITGDTEMRQLGTLPLAHKDAFRTPVQRRHPKVPQLEVRPRPIAVVLAVQEDVVRLDVPVDHGP